MTQTNDCAVVAFAADLYGDQYNDGLLAWAQANGATANQLNDALLQVALANGGVSENVNDALYEMLVSLGYTGHFNDMWWQFWCVDDGQVIQP